MIPYKNINGKNDDNVTMKNYTNVILTPAIRVSRDLSLILPKVSFLQPIAKRKKNILLTKDRKKKAKPNKTVKQENKIILQQLEEEGKQKPPKKIQRKKIQACPVPSACHTNTRRRLFVTL